MCDDLLPFVRVLHFHFIFLTERTAQLHSSYYVHQI